MTIGGIKSFSLTASRIDTLHPEKHSHGSCCFMVWHYNKAECLFEEHIDTVYTVWYNVYIIYVDSKQRFKLMIDYPKNMFNFIVKNDVFPNLSIDINYNNILYSASL